MTGPQRVWMSLAAAEASGIDVSQVLPAIGPRRPGTLYYGAYWQDMNQVLEVAVQVDTTRRCAMWWEISEYSLGYDQRVRNHCTSWEYARGNRVHHGPGDLRRLAKQSA